MNGSEENELRRVKIRASPTTYRALKLACFVLWALAGSSCARFYKSRTEVDGWFAIVFFVGALAVQLLYLWASSSGFIEKVRKKEAKQRFNSGMGSRRDSEK